MSTFADLVLLDELPPGTPSGELDPFDDDDALYESQILDVSLDALHSRAAVLLEFRTAFNFRDDGQAAAVWASGVVDLSWSQRDDRADRTAWNVMSSTVRQEPAGLTLRLDCFPEARLSVTARHWWFVLGSVAQLDRIPDYTSATDDEVQRMNPQWSSEVDVRVGASWSLTD